MDSSAETSQQKTLFKNRNNSKKQIETIKKQREQLVELLQQNPEVAALNCSQALVQQKFEEFTKTLNELGWHRSWKKWLAIWKSLRRKVMEASEKSFRPFGHKFDLKRHFDKTEEIIFKLCADENIIKGKMVPPLKKKKFECDEANTLSTFTRDEEECRESEDSTDFVENFKEEEDEEENGSQTEENVAYEIVEVLQENDFPLHVKSEPTSPCSDELLLQNVIEKDDFTRAVKQEEEEKEENDKEEPVTLRDVKQESTSTDSLDSLENYGEEFVNNKKDIQGIRDGHLKVLEEQRSVQQQFYKKTADFIADFQKSMAGIQDYMKMDVETTNELIELKKEKLRLYEQAKEDESNELEEEQKLESELLEVKRSKQNVSKYKK